MSGFDSARYRQVLGYFPTGVTVVTADPAGQPPVGMTIGSFTSVSLDPPLVGFLPQKNSATWPLIEAAGSFCVNILATEQAELCWRFAKERPDRFAGIEWRPAGTGSPIIERSLAWIDCTIENVVDAGDHVFVIGRVQSLDAATDLDPMLFFRGKLGGFVQST